jgi:hypothetical protein
LELIDICTKKENMKNCISLLNTTFQIIIGPEIHGDNPRGIAPPKTFDIKKYHQSIQISDL